MLPLLLGLFGCLVAAILYQMKHHAMRRNIVLFDIFTFSTKNKSRLSPTV